MIIVCIRGDHPGSNWRFKRALPSLRLCLVLWYHQKPENEIKHTGLVSWGYMHLPVWSFLMKTASGVTWVALISFHRAIFDLLKIVAAVGAFVQPEGQFYWKKLLNFRERSATSLSTILLHLLPRASKVLEGALPGVGLDVESVLAWWVLINFFHAQFFSLSFPDFIWKLLGSPTKQNPRFTNIEFLTKGVVTVMLTPTTDGSLKPSEDNRRAQLWCFTYKQICLYTLLCSCRSSLQLSTC